MINCLFFGDSITYGEYDGILGGWVDDLKRIFHKMYNNEQIEKVNIFNLGIGGENTNGLLGRMEIEISARLSPDKNFIFLSYGANDLVIHDNVEITTPQGFENNICHAIRIADKYADKIFLVKILPISSKIDGVISESGKLRTNERIVRYNDILQSISHAHKIELIDCHSLVLNHVEEYISIDGIHPNDKGYKIISEKVETMLLRYVSP